MALSSRRILLARTASFFLCLISSSRSFAPPATHRRKQASAGVRSFAPPATHRRKQASAGGMEAAFITPARTSSVATSLASSSSSEEYRQVGRREALSRSVAAAASIAFVETAIPRPAIAKKTEPITAETVKGAFEAVRRELTSSDGGVSYLEGAIADGKWDDVLEFTKNYDLEFRKAKMGRARKLLTDKALKDEAVLTCNAVTFDLIGINRAVRKRGEENAEEATKYLNELRNDISKFLEMESTIVVPEE